MPAKPRSSPSRSVASALAREWRLLSWRYRVFAVLGVVELLTFTAFLFHLRRIVAAIGLVFALPLLAIFGFSHLVIGVVKRYSEFYLKNHIFRTLSWAVNNAALPVRAITLGVALWVIDFYVALCSGSPKNFPAMRILLATNVGIAIGYIDFAWRENSHFIRFLSWTYTVIGFLSFFVNITILFAALCSQSIFQNVSRIFQWPPLMLIGDSTAARSILATLLEPTPVWISGILILTVFTMASDAKLQQLQSDASAARVSLVCFVAWLASSILPVFAPN